LARAALRATATQNGTVDSWFRARENSAAMRRAHNNAVAVARRQMKLPADSPVKSPPVTSIT
jgi:hypothetical protein